MPTPSPSIVPSVGPTAGVDRVAEQADRAQPDGQADVAVAIGSAIAVTVPKVNRRMITAAAIPTTSLDSVAEWNLRPR
jgi:hypothetical protein